LIGAGGVAASPLRSDAAIGVREKSIAAERRAP
jgi:hypothetical protein